MSRNTSAYLVTKLQCALYSKGSVNPSSFFAPESSQEGIQAKIRWALFLAKHNIAFLASDHASKLFKKMFPHSKIAKNFGCARTKATTILKEGLAPHYIKNLAVSLASQPFSNLMEESNDATNKSCILLVRTLDEKVGDNRTRFLDMHVVNIGTASNLFVAVQKSLANKGFDFSNDIAFMSDTTNVTKGIDQVCRSWSRTKTITSMM